MKVFGTEISDWQEYSVWARHTLYPSTYKPFEYVYIYTFNNNLVELSFSNFPQLQHIFDETYKEINLSILSIDQVKDLVDQFLINTNKFKTFL